MLRKMRIIGMSEFDSKEAYISRSIDLVGSVGRDIFKLTFISINV